MNTLDLTAAAERAAEPVLRKLDPASEDHARLALIAIGDAMGYGWAQAELGRAWEQKHDCAPRGRMGVTVKDDARPPLAAPPASEPLNPPTAWDLQHRGASTEPRNGTSASEPQAVRNVDDLRDAGADAEQAAIDSLAEPQFDFARAIHYPEHWDMAAYPTLESAIWEALSCAGCSECYPPAEAAPAPKSVWLIERGQKEFHTPTIWYAADSKHPEDARYAGRWTENANRAVKFATQEECEQTVYNEFMRYWGDRRVNCHASEHVFLDRPPAQAEPQPEAIPIAPVEVVRQALKELLESISECRMDQVTARFAKASVMARAVVDRYKDAT